MTESTNNLTSVAKKPSHIAYHVREQIDGKATWTKIGIVWPHRDQKGGTIYVTELPANGRIIFRTIAEGDE